VSKIQQGGGRVNNPADLLRRNQPVKVKVMQLAGPRLSLSMKDVDQATGRDLTPHLRIKSEAEMELEREEHGRRVASGANNAPLGGRGVSGPMDPPVRSAKRLTSPERWEIKQLIASGAMDSSEYPDLDEDMFNPSAAAEVEEELDVEIREEEPPFLAGQTKRSLEMSPVKIVKAPDGTLNRAALAGAALQKERKELRQQELNDEADAEARDFSTPWLDPMAQSGDKVFAQDLRGHLLGQKANEQSSWREQTFNKTTTFGKITNLSIEEQRKGLPIYKLRGPLIQAIQDVSIPHVAFAYRYSPIFSRTKSSSLSAIPDLGRRLSSHSTSPKKALQINVVLVAPNHAVSPPCLWPNVSPKKLDAD
jgi:ATP-dependent RNA helicase DHX8/PRP22